MKQPQNENVEWNRFAAVTNREEVAFRKNLKIELILATESKLIPVIQLVDYFA